MASREMGILMVLLLFCVTSWKSPRPGVAILLVPLSALLAFLPPGLSLPMRKEYLEAAVIPLFIWAFFQDWITVRWRPAWKAALIWVLAVLISGGALRLAGGTAWHASFAGGVILASLLVQAIGKKEESGLLTYIGPLFLIFLLTEFENGLSAYRRYLASLFSGGFYGLLLASLTVILSARLPTRFRTLVALAQVILTYWVAQAAGFSAVVASLVSVCVYAELKLIRREIPELAPFPYVNRLHWLRTFFLLLLILLGWQAHLPLVGNAFLLSGIILVISLGLAGAWILGRFSHMPETQLIYLWQLGALLSAAFLLAFGFLQADLRFVLPATLTVIVSFLGPTMLASVRTYRSQQKNFV